MCWVMLHRIYWTQTELDVNDFILKQTSLESNKELEVTNQSGAQKVTGDFTLLVSRS